jgi:hypothetical protein
MKKESRGPWDAKDLAEQREILRLDFERSAEWRRRKAEEYPNDRRTLEAWHELERLASTVSEIPDEVLGTWVDLWAHHEGSHESEILQERIRQIGFHTSYKTATEFLQQFIADFT